MLVLVTLLCCVLAWQFSVVRERQSALKEIRSNGTFSITTADEWVARYPPGRVVPSAATIPIWRRWLGDEAVQEIWHTPYLQNVSQSELSRLAKIFPEAEFREIHPVPCHPGCFPRGTLVDTPQGRRPIELLMPGDVVTTIGGGEPFTAKIQSVFVTDNRLWQIDTEVGVLFTTQTQPLCLTGTPAVSTAGTIRPAGELQPGDTLLCHYDGYTHSVKVLKVSRTDRTEKVFNVVLGDSEVLIAGGFLARSKPPPEIAAR
jgi:hypothetical protein